MCTTCICYRFAGMYPPRTLYTHAWFDDSWATCRIPHRKRVPLLTIAAVCVYSSSRAATPSAAHRGCARASGRRFARRPCLRGAASRPHRRASGSRAYTHMPRGGGFNADAYSPLLITRRYPPSSCRLLATWDMCMCMYAVYSIRRLAMQAVGR